MLNCLHHNVRDIDLHFNSLIIAFDSKRNERWNYESVINKLKIFELTIIYFRCKVIGIRTSISEVTAVV